MTENEVPSNYALPATFNSKGGDYWGYPNKWVFQGGWNWTKIYNTRRFELYIPTTGEDIYTQAAKYLYNIKDIHGLPLQMLHPDTKNWLQLLEGSKPITDIARIKPTNFKNSSSCSL